MQPTLNNYIELRTTRSGTQKAYVAGTRVRVQDIVSDYERHGRAPEEIATEYPHISLAQVHAALSYYFDHREEIRTQMKADEQRVQRMTDNSPSDSANHKGTDAGRDPLSS